MSLSDAIFPPVETQLKELSSGEEVKVEPQDEDDVEDLVEKIEEEGEEGDEDGKEKGKGKDKKGDKSDDSDVVILSHSEEEEEDIEDHTSSGAHINDEFNMPDAQGRVLVNVGHPEGEEDIFLAPQLARVVKPHQVMLCWCVCV